ncbi:unnamed protein product [Polarella glacialis]|uniref:Uncharacterized protein n=1 Tax=Polarella glacialis TaxID=89957 RepID=A0A813G567_POLGL|nr:unnamed protein product [Polarella glacialis]
MSGDLTMAANKRVTLDGGALACNIFWQVAGYVEVEAGAHMEGILLVKTAAHFRTGSSLNGRILAQTAVTLQSSTVTQPHSCQILATTTVANTTTTTTSTTMTTTTTAETNTTVAASTTATTTATTTAVSTPSLTVAPSTTPSPIVAPSTTPSPTVDGESTTLSRTSSSTPSPIVDTTTMAPGSVAVTTVKGTIDLDVPSCKAFTQREGAVGAVAAGIAKATGVDVKSLEVALTCSRRLTSDGLFARRLEAVNGAYVITIPEDSATITANSVSSAITTAGSEGLTTKIAAAMAAVGITDIAVKVNSISTPTASTGSTKAATTVAGTTSASRATSTAGFQAGTTTASKASGSAPGLLIAAAALAHLL